MSRAWAGGSTRAWRKLRSEVLFRDGGLCQLKLEGCDVYADQVHHIRGKGVSENPDDLQAACRSCNGKAGEPGKADAPPNPPATQW